MAQDQLSVRHRHRVGSIRDSRRRSFGSWAGRSVSARRLKGIGPYVSFNNLDDYLRVVNWMKASADTRPLADGAPYSTRNMIVRTPERTVAAGPRGWFIGGAQGELYPCKPDIIEASREPAETTSD
jgi:hypothetical protein